MKKKLLIVEDSISYSIELERIASDSDYIVIGTENNAQNALSTIYRTLPDIILMDININGNKTGLDIAKEIYHLNIPILFFTSFRN